MNSIATENLAVAYGENLVMDDLDMQIPQEKTTAIIGPNDCGKSTVLKGNVIAHILFGRPFIGIFCI